VVREASFKLGTVCDAAGIVATTRNVFMQCNPAVGWVQIIHETEF
jgi:hypothetical protein